MRCNREFDGGCNVGTSGLWPVAMISSPKLASFHVGTGAFVIGAKSSKSMNVGTDVGTWMWAPMRALMWALLSA